MGKRIAITVLFACCFSCQTKAAMTLFSQETFANVGTLDSGTPGNLGTVTGSFYKRAVGPSTVALGSPGWSAYLSNSLASYHTTTLSGRSTNTGMAGAWFYISQTFVGSGNSTKLITAYATNGVELGSISLWPTNQLYLSARTATTQTNIWQYPLDKWFFLSLVWTNAGGNVATFSAYSKLQGASLSQIGTNATAQNFWTSCGSVTSGAFPSGGGSRWNGRYGMPSIYGLATLADVAYPSDIVEPPTGRNSWYVNPATGSDTNTGISTGTAWQTVTKLNAEMSNCGVFWTTNGLGLGDIVNINNTTTSLDVGTTGLLVTTPGVTVSNTGPLVAYSTISSGGWTLTTGTSKVYQTTDEGATDLTSCVLWENDLWLNLPLGATLASVTNSLQTTPGSFYCDGAKIYVHPFGDTNPSSDGKTYTRSRNRGGAATAAVLVTAANVDMDGINVTKTCLAQKTDADPLGAYCVQYNNITDAGTNRISNYYVSYWSKHGVGSTSTGNNLRIERYHGVYGPGSPYTSAGGQTADVDFGSGTGNSYTHAQFRAHCCPTAARHPIPLSSIALHIISR